MDALLTGLGDGDKVARLPHPHPLTWHSHTVGAARLNEGPSRTRAWEAHQPSAGGVAWQCMAKTAATTDGKVWSPDWAGAQLGTDVVAQCRKSAEERANQKTLAWGLPAQPVR